MENLMTVSTKILSNTVIVYDAENYYLHKIEFFFNCNIAVLLYIWSNKYSLDKHKRLKNRNVISNNSAAFQGINLTYMYILITYLGMLEQLRDLIIANC